MANKQDLQIWISDALQALGGEAHLARVAEHIWKNHESDLKASGDLFYTWQYDMRWAAQKMRDRGELDKLSRSWKLR